MSYQHFVTAVKEKVTTTLGEGIHIQLHTALKNNGKERVGLTITDKRVNISPTIYLEEFYKQFQNGYSIEHITERIVNIYHEVKFEHSWDVHSIKDFEAMKPKIVYKLVHAQKNQTLLNTMPFIAYLDFAIVFYILFEIDDSGTATIPITYDLINLWNTSFEEVQKYAFQNAPVLLPADFKPMQIVIEELMGEKIDCEEQFEDMMYVLTNSIRSFGAACILYDDIKEDIFQTIGENYYILPSSIHEMIIIPESNSPSRVYLNEMVDEVNRTQLDEEEFLSDHVYYYDGKSKTLS